MQKKSLVLIYRGKSADDKDHMYEVVKATNTVEHRVGDMLKEQQVDSLISHSIDYTVTKEAE